MTATVLLLSLGGTISSEREDGGGALPRVGAAELSAQVAAWTCGIRVVAREFRRLPSPALSLADLLALHEEIRTSAAEFDGVVVSQGTDTIEETAYLLDVLGSGRDRPVVVTGAMRDRDAPGPDGPANLVAALDVACSPAARGVLVVLGDRILAGRRVRKDSSVLVDAFTADPGGLLGTVNERRVHLPVLPAPAPALAAPPDAEPTPRVALLGTGVGDDLALLKALPDLGYAGAVLQGMGGGHVAPVARDRLLDLPLPVVLTTRTSAGPALRSTYGYPGGEIDLLASGLIWGGHLSGVRARILLMLCLGLGFRGPRLRREFERIAAV